jgi:hypothetical protein
MEGVEIAVAIICVLALVLLAINLLAYKRERSRRLLLTIVVFALFFVKGVVMSISIFTTSLDDVAENMVLYFAFDAVILLFLFFSILSPPKSRVKDSDSKDTEKGKT